MTYGGPSTFTPEPEPYGPRPTQPPPERGAGQTWTSHRPGAPSYPLPPASIPAMSPPGGWPVDQSRPSRGLSAAPTAVKVAFWLQVSAAATLVVIGFLFMVLAAQDLGNPFLTQDAYAIAWLVLLACLLGLGQAIALGIFSKFLLDGANWARIASTAVLASTILSNFIALALGVAIIVLLFVTDSGRWFARSR